MTAFVGGEETEGKHLKAKSGWKDNGNGLDTYGFSAMPGGFGRSDGSFDLVGNNGNWWSTSEYRNHRNYYRIINYNRDRAIWYNHDENNLFGVRCLQD